MLSNPLRLRLLTQIVVGPDRCVSDLAEAAGLSVSVASQYLRDLQARGLVGVRRQSRWVRYVPTPDAAVGHATALLEAVATACIKEKRPFRRTVTVCKAFAHPRRVAVVRWVASAGPANEHRIAHATGISRRALSRHLARLRATVLVQGPKERWTLTPAPAALVAALVKECRA